jgi:hypothetical protein
MLRLLYWIGNGMAMLIKIFQMMLIKIKNADDNFDSSDHHHHRHF